MNPRFLAFGVCAFLAANSANASVYFDNTGYPPAGYDGATSDNTPLIADSFTASNPSALSIQLQLSADNPSDSGSILVYLAPDNGSGNSAGTAGAPDFDTGGTFTGITGADQLLATIPDSSLSTTLSGPSLVTVTALASTVASVTTATSDDEYWVVVAAEDGSSFDWWYDSITSPPASPGSAGQATLYDAASVPYVQLGDSLVITPDSSGGVYEMNVSDVPEPASFAVLGVGLVGLGYFRRRMPTGRAPGALLS